MPSPPLRGACMVKCTTTADVPRTLILSPAAVRASAALRESDAAPVLGPAFQTSRLDTAKSELGTQNSEPGVRGEHRHRAETEPLGGGEERFVGAVVAEELEAEARGGVEEEVDLEE